MCATGVRTNIDIDDLLLAEAQKLAGTQTKKATVEFALAELIRRRKAKGLLAYQLYRAARRQGLTIRRTTDCLNATVCIRADRPLLRNDADFDHLALVSPLELVRSP